MALNWYLYDLRMRLETNSNKKLEYDELYNLKKYSQIIYHFLRFSFFLFKITGEYEVLSFFFYDLNNLISSLYDWAKRMINPQSTSQIWAIGVCICS